MRRIKKRGDVEEKDLSKLSDRELQEYSLEVTGRMIAMLAGMRVDTDMLKQGHKVMHQWLAVLEKKLEKKRG